MSRHRKAFISDNDTSGTVDAIRGICNGAKCASTSEASTMDTIRKKCDTELSPTTIDAIREICVDFNSKSRTKNSSNNINTIYKICNNNDRSNDSTADDRHRPVERYDPGTAYFNSVISPVTSLTPQYSGVTSSAEFRMRRKNKTVTLQWEPFSGTMAATGVSFLTVVQSMWNTPPYPMSWPIYIRYKDINKITNITVDPSSSVGNVKFYLNTDGTATGINMGDAFYVYSGSISWIVD